MTDLSQSVCSPERTLTRYRTIVVDPPWDYEKGWPAASTSLAAKRGFRVGRTNERRGLDYQSMTLTEIHALPGRRAWALLEVVFRA